MSDRDYDYDLDDDYRKCQGPCELQHHLDNMEICKHCEEWFCKGCYILHIEELELNNQIKESNKFILLGIVIGIVLGIIIGSGIHDFLFHPLMGK